MIATARLRRSTAALFLLGLLVLLVPALARADQRLYWLNADSNSIAFTGLDGTGGGSFATGEAQITVPAGLAYDSSAQRLYWASHGTPNERIGFGDLVGSGSGNFETGNQRAEAIRGVAVDPSAGKLFWASNNGLFVAPLDGSGGAPLETGGLASGGASGLVVDPPSGRVYWTTGRPETPIAFANLDGSGQGGTLTIAGEGGEFGSAGLAIDHLNGRIYWADRFASEIWSANLDGSDPQRLNPGAATVSFPAGLAIDPAAGKIYWGNNLRSKLSVANLDGSGGEDLITPGATQSSPTSPVLLFSPQSVGPPLISGAAEVGSTLTCSSGAWANDLLESSLYRAPASFGFQWSRDGTDLPGATGSTLTATVPSANYQCRVTARNAAGSATASSGPHAVVAAGGPAVATVGFAQDARVLLSLAAPRITAKSPVPLLIVNHNPFLVEGAVVAREVSAKGAKGAKKAPPKPLPPVAFELAANSETTIALKLPAAQQKALAKAGKLTLSLSASVSDPAKGTRSVASTVVVKLQQTKKPKKKTKAGRR
jgi:DNA-binding beta-propeller fold protein YncE